MCTINSLDKGKHLVSFYSSLRTVLVLLAICFDQDSSGALKASHLLAGINVTAPPDITINIKRSSGCDTLINIGPATYSGQCGPDLTFTTYSIFSFLNTNGGNMYFTTGVFKVYFTVEDDCRNTGIDSMLVTVYDATAPNVICNPEMTMNLPSNGFMDSPAWIFDAGSSDNCGHVYFKVKRMFPSLGGCSPGNPTNEFDDQLRFCCADVDSAFILVILRVYDIYPGAGQVSDSLLKGRFIDCMVRAFVKDKIAPDIDCPNNITVNCGADLDSLLAANANPFVSDNCSTPRLDSLIIVNLNACGAGTIHKTYLATDTHGQTSSCTYIITVNKVITFNGLDPNQLKWPANKIVFACRIDIDTINAGIPEITEDGCANVLIAHHDEKYNFDRGGVCAKILRYWEVIDWCKYNPGLLPNPKILENGYYHYTQEIKIMDTVAPVISGLQDTIIGIQTADCQPGQVILPAVVANDCGSTSNITIHYEVDFYNDGTIDRTGQGGNASGIYPIGRHLLKFYANDSCHNTGTLEIILEVFDSKPPNANAIFGLASSLIQMQAGPMVSIRADLFNEKSTDNCTENEDLKFSFSSDINDTLRIFNCDSLGLKIIHLVVWDQAGNSSEVITFITIQDVYQLCPSSLQGTQLAGKIQTSNDQVIRDVEVNLLYDQVEKHTTTDIFGNFFFNSIPKNKRVTLKSKCNKNFSSGITTADIIKIQRHVLGIEIFGNPVDLLAADVDFNQKITTKDIVWLRKLILGQISEIPNQDSYIFINKQYAFSIPQNPFGELDSCKQIVLEASSDVNAVQLLGIKLGDVNHSFKANGLAIENSKQINLSYQITEGKLEVFVMENGFIDGFQFELNNKDLCPDPWTGVISNLENWSDANFKHEGNAIRVSYSSNHSFWVDPKSPLLVMPLNSNYENCNPNIFLDSEFQNEIYKDNEIYTIKTIVNNPLQHKEEEQIAIHPNPFSDQMNVLVNLLKESNIQLEVYGLDLKKVFSKEYQIPSGKHIIVIKKEELSGNGMYILQIRSNQLTRIFKIINE